ncbi:hypothetical protein [Alloactinosynnema sp. L-07]|uniref:hypothetical protein n=1 Tax=Alloactinosynnema sp. L-07 TaxID=1653480 RepID=UPI00065EF23C|nr:hypothetical protein [Alloactinosynnema sp. L-07]CRK59759.1 hypothetical protein [Alloactinosynnema sp. L-07]
MLALDFPGVAELRAQADSALVVGRCGCGCATIDLAVPETAPLAKVESATPVWADVPATGEGLILLVDYGRLSCLEIYGTEEPVSSVFPEPKWIVPVLEDSYWTESDEPD